MVKNVNHVNYFAQIDKKEEVATEKVVEEVKGTVVPVTTTKEHELIVELQIDKEDVLYGLTKSEQVEILEKLGMSKKEIRKLRYEKQRVDKILSFVRK